MTKQSLCQNLLDAEVLIAETLSHPILLSVEDFHDLFILQIRLGEIRREIGRCGSHNNP
jgi:hypothetical protein